MHSLKCNSDYLSLWNKATPLHQWGGLHRQMHRLQRIVSDRLLSSPRPTSAWMGIAQCIDDAKPWNAETVANGFFWCKNCELLMEALWVSFASRKFHTMPIAEYVLKKVSWIYWLLVLLFFSRGWDNHVDISGCTWSWEQVPSTTRLTAVTKPQGPYSGFWWTSTMAPVAKIDSSSCHCQYIHFLLFQKMVLKHRQ